MIAQQYGSSIRVLDDRSGGEVASFYVGPEAEVLGNTDSYVLIRNGDSVYTTDLHGFQLGWLVLTPEDRVSRISESGFSVRKGSILENYAPSCQRIGSTYL